MLYGFSGVFWVIGPLVIYVYRWANDDLGQHEFLMLLTGTVLQVLYGIYGLFTFFIK